MALKGYLANIQYGKILAKDFNEILFQTYKKLSSRHEEEFDGRNFNLEEIAKSVIPKFQADYTKLTKKEVRHIILLFQHEYNGNLLCEEHENIQKLLEAIVTINSPNNVQKLLLRLLVTLNRNFQRYHEQSLEYAEQIIELLSVLDQHQRSTKRTKSFLQKYNKFPIYNGGMSDFVSYLVKNIQDIEGIREEFKSLRIPTSDNAHNILYIILDQYLDAVPKNIDKDMDVSAYYEFFVPDIKSIKYLKYANLRAKVIESILGIFVENYDLVSYRNQIVQYIDSFVGDPRVYKHRDNWLGVNEELKSFYLKYKIKVSIEFFFDYISEGAERSEEGRRHWEQRRSYWSWFLKNDLIDDAWVILGSAAERSLKSEIQKDPSLQQFGRGNLRDNTKSHIMMRIQDVIFVECSHSGRLWIFDADSKDCPYFGQKAYTRSQFDVNDGLVHSSGWQKNVDTLIANRTRINLAKLRRGY